MTRNHSTIVDPTGDCSNPQGFVSDSGSSGVSPRCEVPVSSIVCVHLEPPLFVPVGSAAEKGDPSGNGFPATSSSSSKTGSNLYGGRGGDSSSSSSSAWPSTGRGGTSDSSWGDDNGSREKEEERAYWVEEMCATNGTENSTLWAHLDDVEEAVWRYKV